ncbi:hypothetical protein B0F90DRAFT_766810 [Multifurca ochricompacta]|uniref:Plasma membrane proteolipid 3 n=1 Tax=Multifurca ochricompacta TaxID=376703 RepID=A0AAD4QS13_9AGAM|nr:hypothetical protein B0F90DRAFT_766810 [Multifurca ochricompacta]
MAVTGSDICKVCFLFYLSVLYFLLTTFATFLQIFFAIFVPPVGVFLERGCNADFLINILLTILGYIPGIIHALYIILKY